MAKQWQQISSKIIYEKPWVRFREDEVRRPDGSAGIYTVFDIPLGSVCVLPLTDFNEVWMVKQERYPTGVVSWELPAGGSDGQESLEAAMRELKEETGLVATSWILMANQS